MIQNQRYRIDYPQVVCEAIDGEVVIVHLERGYYFSLLKTGAEVWAAIEQQQTPAAIAAQFVAKYDASQAEISAAITTFFSMLQAEALIVPDLASAGIAPSIPVPENSSKMPFEPPLLEKFTDMEDLLLLDPIHEVNVEAGWPIAKSA
jgi:Coenzyme PQQ synthesis protein D (PqqD)